MFKVNNRNTRTRCEICSKPTIKQTPERRCVNYVQSSKLTIKTPERRHWRRFDVFIVTFKHISYGAILLSLLLALNTLHTLFASASLVNFEQGNTGWAFVSTFVYTVSYEI